MPALCTGAWAGLIRTAQQQLKSLSVRDYVGGRLTQTMLIRIAPGSWIECSHQWRLDRHRGLNVRINGALIVD